MQGAPFFIGFFIILLLLAAQTDQSSSLGDAASTSTSPSVSLTSSDGTTNTSRDTTLSAPQLSNTEIEREIAQIYRELDNLNEELRELKLREPASPYVGMIDLRIGSARSTNPNREYLLLQANSKNTGTVPISDWYLESYVTEERAALPGGVRIMETRHTNTQNSISLLPGERAYLITGEPPLYTSFHENLCTGYLTNYADFYPSLRWSCPDADDEMARFADIALDNDSCYDFVERISRCEVVDENELEEADLTRSCESFIENTLNYTDCVSLHRYDPFFDDIGYWRIYLDRDEDFWRKEREIIRLMDENDRVIDVIEY